MDSRLNSGTGVLLFRLFLLPCPRSATSVILCLKFKMATISLTPFSDGFRSNSIEDHKSRTNLDSARFDVYSPDGTRPLFLFTDLLLPPTLTPRSVGLPLRRR